MTRKCLSKKRSLPSKSTSACSDRCSVYYSNLEFLSNNPLNSFYLNTKKDPSVLFAGYFAAVLEKDFSDNG